MGDKVRHRVVIRRQRPWLVTTVVALLVLGAGAAGWGLLRYVRASGVGSGEPSGPLTLRDERDALLAEVRDLRRELAESQGRETFALRSCEIDAEACRALRLSLSAMEKESAGLREQLAFYRHVVAPDQAQTGARVLELAVLPGDDADSWRYDLVLVQGVGQSQPAEGSFQFELAGLSAGKPMTLTAAQLAREKSLPQVYSFRYFEEFGGEIVLPQGFQPQRLTVTLTPKGEAAAARRAVETFEWSALIEAGRR